MAVVINMPRLSDTMEEGTVSSWLKKVGDKVAEGDILAEIETDKATMEFESFNEGTLLYVGIAEGETAPVDSLLAIIGDENEDFSSLLSTGNAQAESTEEDNSSVKEESNQENTAVAIPKGVEIIRMPRLSDTMEEGTVSSWLKKEGDAVSEGEILAEIETDKATMEFESFYNGTLLHIGIGEGESSPVDHVLAVIGEKGTNISSLISQLSSLNKSDEPVSTPVEPVQKKPEPVAEKKTSAIVENKPAHTPKKTSSGRLFVSPLAKKLASEKGIDLTTIIGTGDVGRIIKRDIENYQPSQGYSAKVTGVESQQTTPNSPMRKAIAKRLSQSKFTSPHYYLNVELDMDNTIAFRKQYNSIPDTKISFNDIVVKATALALKQYPQVNAQWNDKEIIKFDHVHVGVAVGIEDGLVVPVIRFTDEQSLTEIGRQVKDYAKRAQTKKLAPEEMDGSTFTISNLGMYGIESFTSIINPPNASILSVGAIVQKPVVKENQIVVGNTMKLTLASDHRVIDGATGAQFLKLLREYIENPIRMLV